MDEKKECTTAALVDVVCLRRRKRLELGEEGSLWC
jgi:hypothetical protein